MHDKRKQPRLQPNFAQQQSSHCELHTGDEVCYLRLSSVGVWLALPNRPTKKHDAELFKDRQRKLSKLVLFLLLR